MKKITLLFALLFSVIAAAQNYPGKSPELLLNKQVKVLETAENIREYGYDNFYKDKSLSKKYACCENFNSKYDKLVNRTFTVKEVKPFGKYSTLILEDDKETIYFKYDPKYEFKFPFEVIGGLTLPADFYCDRVRKTEMNGKTFFISNIDEGMKFIKIIESRGVFHYVSMNISSKEKTGTEEATLTLENGTVVKSIMPTIKSEPREDIGGYVHNAYFSLRDEDIELLKQHKITAQSIGDVKREIEQGDSHKGVFNCLTESGKELEMKSHFDAGSGCNYKFSKSSDDVREGWDVILSETIDGITFIKFIERDSGAEEYQAYVLVLSPEEKRDKLSGILLLTGDKSIEKPNAEVTCKTLPQGNGYLLSVYMELTNEDVELLKEYSIADKMVYLEHERVGQGDKLKHMFKCLLEEK